MFGRDRNQERTPEDRARAAAQRAERRAARAGRRANPLPTEAFLHSAPPPPDESPEAEPADEERPTAAEPADEERPTAAEPADEERPTPAEPAAEERPAAQEPSTPAEPAVDGSPVAPAVPDWAGHEPADPAEGGWASDGPAPDGDGLAWTGEQQPTQDAPAPQPAGFNGAWEQIDWATPPEAEEPAPQPDPPAAAPVPAATAVQTAPPRAPRRPVLRRPAGGVPRGIGRPPRPARRWGRRAGALLALLAIGGALYAINAVFQPFHGDASGTVRVRIPDGADAGEIGKRLVDAGVIDSATAFSLNATFTGRRDDLHSGDYTLQTGMSNGEALDALVRGPASKAVAASFKLTIPEGRSRREIVPLVKDTSLEGSYLRASSAPASMRRARRLGAPRGTKTLEGFLFPATYDLRAGQSAGGLVDKQLDAFADNFDGISLRYAKRKRLTRYDVVTIASMIEREAALARERPLISAVIYNRLKRGMPLGIDATIRYATNNWTKRLRQSDLARDSAYNTRLRRGLPPTPIGNPGLSSLEAAAKPAKVSYLYYVVKPCGDGAHAFSSTEEGFDRDYRRYHKALESRGKSPSKC